MLSSSEDINGYRLETEFYSQPYHVIHTFHDKDLPRDLQVDGGQRWDRQESIGRGSFGTVWRESRHVEGRSTAPGERAVKDISKAQMRRMRVDYKRELAALTGLSQRKYFQSGNFVEFYGWFEDNDKIYIAMEYFTHGTLIQHIQDPIQDHEVKMITFQLLQGLEVMHKEGFTHRDLKPENIFIYDTGPKWRVKIGDFGISKRVANSGTALRTTGAGTPLYRAPEIIIDMNLEDDEVNEYTEAVDIWSLACVVYEMASSTILFPEFPRDYKRLCKGVWFPTKPETLSQKGMNFIQRLLVPDPAGRPSAEEAIGDDWFGPHETQPSLRNATKVSRLDKKTTKASLSNKGLDRTVRPNSHHPPPRTARGVSLKDAKATLRPKHNKSDANKQNTPVRNLTQSSMTITPPNEQHDTWQHSSGSSNETAKTESDPSNTSVFNPLANVVWKGAQHMRTLFNTSMEDTGPTPTPDSQAISSPDRSVPENHHDSVSSTRSASPRQTVPYMNKPSILRSLSRPDMPKIDVPPGYNDFLYQEPEDTGGYTEQNYTDTGYESQGTDIPSPTTAEESAESPSHENVSMKVDEEPSRGSNHDEKHEETYLFSFNTDF